MLPPSPIYACTKVIIFDWDDTICPSTFVDTCNLQSYSEMSCELQELMDKIGEVAEKCLEAASRYGEVIIITNSDDGWVHFSAERYVPNLVRVLSKYRIVSARTAYEHFYPGQPLCWKAAAFAHEVNETFAAHEHTISKSNLENDAIFESSFDTLMSTDESSDDSQLEDHRRNERKTSPRNFRARKAGKKVAALPQREVISFGDSIEERTAVKIVSGQLSAISKSVMFLASPSPVQLIGQLYMLTGHMKSVCENIDSLDLEIAPNQAEKLAASLLRKKSNSQSQYNRMSRIRRSSAENDVSKENDVNVGNLPTETLEETFSV
mmetsp:Transcript_28279/g.34945  ORF Transcript_28279/g.34945 Transcript_28279/m.34945 type:complete len:322 (+) Transcript_28279:156-1121(+)